MASSARHRFRRKKVQLIGAGKSKRELDSDLKARKSHFARGEMGEKAVSRQADESQADEIFPEGSALDARSAL
jgi:hypothetical protein